MQQTCRLMTQSRHRPQIYLRVRAPLGFGFLAAVRLFFGFSKEMAS